MSAGPEQLALISLITAILTGALGGLIIFKPASAAAAFAAFPRHKNAGMILTVIALIWSALMINQMTLGELSKYKNLLYVLTPLALYLVMRYLEELLAPRALGGLLMLFPTVMTDAARWHDSSWRLVVVVVAYIMVILGIWLMLSPYKFRVWTSSLTKTPGRARIGGLILLIISGLLVTTTFFTA
ncbi:MAG: hypothetical protein ACO398_10555 [Kiritimatiellia bacterium]